MSWTIEKTNRTTSTFRITLERNKSWEQYVLWCSDAHFDNKHANRKLLKKHFDEAKERNAIVNDAGDFLCLMQGRGDNRSRKQDTREQHQHESYSDQVINEAIDFLGEYKDNIGILGTGNHEMKFLKFNGTDPTNRLVSGLRRMGSNAVYGGYRGWVRFLFQTNSGANRQSMTAYFTHGAGGGGVVTKGTLNAQRHASWIDGAELVFMGHIHEAWSLETCKAVLDNTGKEKILTQTHFSIPGYKEEFLGQIDGFHHERDAPPKPQGAWWVRFYWDGEKVNYDYRRAK